MATLITGASGMLGTALAFTLHARQQPLCLIAGRHELRMKGAGCWTGDLTAAGAAESVIREFRPRCVIHCAAHTNVDWCESHAADAAALNVDVTRRLAQAAAQIQAAFVYISTDSVFNGERGDYDETSTPDPRNVYAQTKLAGERAAQSTHPSPLIVRTCIYGWNPVSGKGLAEWIVGRLLANQRAGCFIDVTFTPILANSLAEIVLQMTSRGLTGLYHVGGRTATSKFDFARRLAQVFGLDDDLIVPTRLVDHAFVAPRPQHTTLAGHKTERALGCVLPDLDAGLQTLRALRDSRWPDAAFETASISNRRDGPNRCNGFPNPKE